MNNFVNFYQASSVISVVLGTEIWGYLGRDITLKEFTVK